MKIHVKLVANKYKKKMIGSFAFGWGADGTVRPALCVFLNLCDSASRISSVQSDLSSCQTPQQQMQLQLDWALRLNKSCSLAVAVHFLAVWFRLVGNHVLICPHSGDSFVAYPCLSLPSLPEAKTKAHPHPVRLWKSRGQFGPPGRSATWA